MDVGHANADVCVVGAGIVGLAHARAAAEAGHSVVVFDRSAGAAGASIRNFGMIWPIGVAGTPLHGLALRSRQLWLEAAAAAGFWCVPCGSIHLAHAEDERAVLGEFAELSGSVDCEILSAREVRQRSVLANASGLLGGLWSPTELAIDPREAVPALADWLARRRGVRFVRGEQVREVRDNRLRTSSGAAWDFRHCAVCTNVDIDLLFPSLFRRSGLRRCKLQMLRTAPRDDLRGGGPHLAGGLSLRHYGNFSRCPTVARLGERVARESPLLDRYGIHVLAAVNRAGEITLGDSHEYDDAISPFDSTEIERLIMREAARLFELRDAAVAQRWHGVYVRHRSVAIFESRPLPTVSVHANANGLGMTLSLAAAERFWRSEAFVPAVDRDADALIEHV
jgi:FAD dependent oxidoreductase TIGR03364